MEDPDRQGEGEMVNRRDGDVTIAAAEMAQQFVFAIEDGNGKPRIKVSSNRYFGDYEVLEEIGHGGMGVVYKARQLSLDGRLVALKMIRSGELASEEQVKRFHSEAAAAATLNHPNIVAIHQIGEHEGQHYFSMQLIEGQSLAEAMGDYKMPPLETKAGADKSFVYQRQMKLAQLMAKVARTVHAAHQQRIIHRDLKPGNILLDARNEPHIADFGLAKRLDAAVSLSQSGDISGTLHYMSPEQASGRNKYLTTATDVYSLGAIIYHFLAGHPQFAGDSALTILRRIEEEEPKKPSALDPRINRDLETICLKCMEKDPGRRYGSAEALAEDLENWVEGKPIRARPSTYRYRLRKWCRRKPLIAGLLAALCGVAVLGFFGILWQWREARNNAANAQKALAESYVSQAQARRMSGAAGQRTQSIAALREACPYHTNKALLRDQLIAVLALPDLAECQPQVCPTSRPHPFEVNPDARVVAEAEADGTVRVRSLEGGALLNLLPGSGAPVEKLRFGPGALVLVVEYATAPQRQVTVWQLKPQRSLFTKLHGINADAIDFTPDGTALALGQPDGRVLVYAIPGGEILHELELRLPWGAPRAPQVIRFHSSGKLLAESCLDDLYVQIWDLDSTDVIARLPHPDVVHSLAWEPNGGLLATACRDSNLYLWKTNDASRPWKIGGHEGPVVAVAFNPSGTFLASLGLDETVRLWVPATGRQLVRRLDGEGLARLWFSASNQWLIVADQQQRKSQVWQTFGVEYVALHLRGTPASRLTTIDFSPNARWLAAASGERAAVWETESCRESTTLTLTDAHAAWFSADSQQLLASTARGLFGYQLAGRDGGPAPPANWSQAPNELGTMAVTPDRSLAAIAHPDEILLVSLKPGTNTAVRSVPVGVFYQRLVLHPQGKWVVGMLRDSNAIHLWDLSDGNESRAAAVVPSSQYFGFSPCGQWLVACWGGKYEFYQVGAWTRPVFVIPRKTASDQHAPIAFTSDGRIAALAATRYTIELVRLPQNGLGEPGLIATLEAPDRYPLELLAFSPDGRRLAAAVKDQTIQMWNLALLGKHLAELNLHANWPTFQ